VKSPKWKHQRNRKNEDIYLEQYWNEDKGLIITELPAGRHTKDSPWPEGMHECMNAWMHGCMIG
jgi:hypothetical protein